MASPNTLARRDDGPRTVKVAWSGGTLRVRPPGPRLTRRQKRAAKRARRG